MRIIFIYAGDPNDGRIQSPYSITKNVYKYLSERAEVVYYQWDATHPIDVRPDDIVIGHPHYDTNTLIQQLFIQDRPCRARCVIHPLHHGRPEDNLPFDHIARKADKIFSICGPYWYDTIESSPFAHWKSKITRLDMAIDSGHFPFLKTRFNDIGHRKLVYIGSSMPQKNLGFMTKIKEHLPGVKMSWYGGYGEHPLARTKNVQVYGWQVLDSALAQKIVNEHDIFINTSHSDANPTTALETTSWGLIPIMTKESGYWPNRSNPLECDEICLDNVVESVNNINKLLTTPSDILMERSVRVSQAVRDYYTWDRFCAGIWNGLQQFM